MDKGVRLLVSAGEHSGDLRAGAVLAELKRDVTDLQIRGLGGDSLQASGLCSEFDLNQLSVMGFVEVLKRLPFFIGVMRRMETLLDEWNPHRVLLVDYPGFNLRLASKAAKRGIPVTYYISPQIWAWGKGRIRRIVKSVQQMLVLFEFEAALYERHGMEAEFVGHPLVDEISDYRQNPGFLQNLEVQATDRVVGLLPGSRMQEVRAHLPILLETAAGLDGITPVVGLAPGIPKETVSRGDIRITRDIHGLLEHAYLVVAASGTVTLEAALFQTPMIVVYKTGLLSGLIARLLIDLPYVAMANVVAGRMVVPEFLQTRCKPDLLVREIRDLLECENRRNTMRHDLAAVAQALGPPGASVRAAQAIARQLAEESETATT